MTYTARATMLVVGPVLIALAGVASADPASVLLLYGEAGPVPAIAAFDRGIKSTLQSGPAPVRFFTESLDSSWSMDPRYEQALADLLLHKYAGRKLDLVVPCLDSAIRFTLQHRDRLFPGVPVVFCGATSAIEAGRLPPGVTGVAMLFDWAATAELALRLHPGTERIVYVGGASPAALAYEAAARRALARFQGRVQLEYLTGLPMARILDRIRSLPERTVILYGIVLLDGAGASFTGPEGLALVRRVSAVPVYSNRDSLLGHGIVGGPLVGFETQGLRAGELGHRMLRGERLGSGDVVLDTNAYAFDARELARFRIDERRLPAGSTVQFRPAPTWWPYRWHIAGILAVVGAESALIVALLAQRANRRRAEARLRASEVELRRLTGRLLQAQETESRRIARELHDDLSQGLALLTVQMDMLRRKPPDTADGLEARVQEMVGDLKRLSSSVHDLSHQLHPSKLEQLGLVTALRGLCHEMTRSHALKIEFSDDRVPPEIPLDSAVCLYRIAQEGLRNAVKHGHPQRVDVELEGTADGVSLRITDDGAGFDPRLVQDRGGLGLVSMRERVFHVGGRITVDSQPSDGTRLHVVVPLAGAPAVTDAEKPA